MRYSQRTGQPSAFFQPATHLLWRLYFAGLLATGFLASTLVAEPPILMEGHVDMGVIYESGELKWRFNADGATSEGGSLGNLQGLYAPDELYVRVPDSVRFAAPSALPGNPLVTGSNETGMIWWLPSSGGLSNVPFLGWSWDLGLPSPPQITPSQWQDGRIKVELLEASKPSTGNASIWIGGTNQVSTFDPSVTNAPFVDPGSNSFVLTTHDHYNWGFTAEGVYDLTLRASGTHLIDGYKETQGTFRFLVGDVTNPAPEVSIEAAYVYHSAWSGQGDPADLGRVVAREGMGPQTLSLDNLINSAQGINGIVFEMQNLPDGSELALSDFHFQVSPQGAFDPSVHPFQDWQPAPAPTSVSVAAGDPARVIVQWPDNSIENRWLRATVQPTAATGLDVAATFYIGHLRGETTGLSGETYTVAFSDITPIRSAIGQSVDSSSTMDIDKNGTVAFADISAMRGNVGAQLTNITIP
jgi:surface-anchored protein